MTTNESCTSIKHKSLAANRASSARLSGMLGSTLIRLLLVCLVSFMAWPALATVISFTTGSQSVTNAPGGSTTYTSTVTVSGTETVTFSVISGLPAGATASFNPPSATRNGGWTTNTTLTVGTSLATPPGTYTFGVVATGKNNNITNQVTLTVVPLNSTTITLNTSASPSTYGSSVTFTAQVSSTGGTPTGEVMFQDGAVVIGTATLAAGEAIFTTNKLVAATHSITATFSGNGSFGASTSSPVSQVVEPATLTVLGVVAQNKTYDGTATAPLDTAGATLSGVVSGDDVTLNTIAAEGTFADKVVGTGKAVSITGLDLSGTDSANYTLTQPSASADIDPRPLTVTATAENKVYDGAVGATVLLADDRITGDLLSATYLAATFADKNVAVDKPVQVTGISLSGPDAGNYTANTTASAMANISALGLTVTAVDDTKVYDGSTSSVGVPTHAALAGSDTAAFTQSFDNKNVGTDKTLTPAGTVTDGNGGQNYDVTFVSVTTGSITAHPLTVTAVTDIKVYDGSTSSVGVPTHAALAGSDTAAFTQSFDNKNVGTDKTVTPAGTVTDGNGGQNYDVTFVSVATGSITARPLTVNAVTDTKVYDGSTSSVGVPTHAALEGSDTATFTQSFDNKNVGTDKTLTPAGTVTDGNGGLNYDVTLVSVATGSITPVNLTVRADDKSRAYGADNPVLTASYSGFVGGDTQGTALTGSPDLSTTASAGSPMGTYPISVAQGDLAASNYTFTFTDGSLSVVQAVLTVTADNQERAYGSTNAELTLKYSGFVNGDTSSVLSGAAEVTTTADTNSPVSGSPYSITVAQGTLSAANYSLAFVAGELTVTQAVLTLRADDLSKVYGTAVPGLTYTYTGFVNGEDSNVLSGSPELTTSATATSGVVGSPYSITVAMGDLSAENYSIETVDGNLTVTPASVTPAVVVSDKVYDGALAGTISDRNLTAGVVGSDDVLLSGGTALFADKEVGVGKDVAVSGLALTGLEAANYALATTSLTTTASITPRGLEVGITAQSKVYDGTPAATVTFTDDRVQGDTLVITSDPATFADKNVGSAKVVTAAGIAVSGIDAGNYSPPNATATAPADITARPLTVTAVTDAKAYDGTTSSAGVPEHGALVGSDTAAFKQSFDNKNVGVDKTLTPGGTVTDGNGGLNYDLTLVSVSTGEITPASLTITADDKTKQQGTANPLLTATYTGFVNGETASVLTTLPTLSTTADATSPVGTYPITVTGAVAENYAITYTPGTLTVIGSPQLTDVIQQADQFLFTFSSVTGQQYQVEATDSLLPPAWASIGDIVVGTGGWITITNEITGPQRFFRLQVVPGQGN